MKEYLASQVRNVAILGHLGSGKTSLAESVLYVGKAIAKKGEVERKSTVSDYLVEEQTRQTSLSTALLPVEWNGFKINFLDTPGSEEFVGEVENDLTVCSGAVLLIDATKGVEVGTERLWDELRSRNIPTIIFINKMDKENVKFEKVLENIKSSFGPRAIPLCWPIGQENDFRGFVDAIDKKAQIFNGKQLVDAEIPAELTDQLEELTMTISEAVAETSEELLEKFFGGEELTPAEVKQGVRTGTLSGEIFPIIVGSATKDITVDALLSMIGAYLPSPVDQAGMKAINTKDGSEIAKEVKEEEPFSAYVFKTLVDPFLGTISFFKVQTGSTANLAEVYVPNIDSNAKVGQFITLMGKNQIAVDVLHAGDIGAVAKMGELATGYTMCDKKAQVRYVAPELPTPVIYVAIAAKTKQDEDKMSTSLQKLNLEDPSFEIKRNPETAQLLIGGQGMTHIGYILEKMKNMFKVEVTQSDQKIVYRETIRKTGSAQGRHKKQSGGAGQFGDVWIRFEPSEVDFEFASEVVGGSVPKNYFPAVEKGLQDCLVHGPLAGFPVIGVRAVLYDGSYHPVDSNEISFKIAAALSFKEACKSIKPTILEPVMEVKVIVKSDYVGDVMGDMNKRRGQVLGIDPLPNGKQCITAEVPEAEITKYATDLKAMTQASGRFSRRFVRYADVPEHLVAKIIAEYKKEN
ncbi:MAG: elongation factor G [Bacilli bacterium]|nr:elongation factor G [Bacilli bacterium]